MKKRLLTFLLAVTSYCSYAQNSIFPTDGINVGIGTTNPAYRLTMNSAAETGILTIDNSTSVYLSHGGWAIGAGKFGIGNPYVPTLVVATTANAVSSVGNVGMGTMNPLTKLEVSGTGNPYIRLSSNSTATDIASWYFDGTNSVFSRLLGTTEIYQS